MKTLREIWLSYLERVVPNTAGPVQVEETRRAFYAGAIAILGAAYQLGEETVSVDDGVVALEALYNEAEEYVHSVEQAVQQEGH